MHREQPLCLNAFWLPSRSTKRAAEFSRLCRTLSWFGSVSVNNFWPRPFWRGVRAVIIGHNRYVGPLYAALGQTGRTIGAILARFGVGHDGLDKTLARRHGIVVTNTPGTLDASVAEHVLWLLGNLVKQVGQLDAAFRGGQFAGYTGIELWGKTLGLVGCGGIARQVARIAHFGFGMGRVLACGRRSSEQLEQDEGRPITEILARLGLDQYTSDPDLIFHQSDVVSVHLPAKTDTRHFVDARRLALLKPTAWLINTSRGSVVDESARTTPCAAAGSPAPP